MSFRISKAADQDKGAFDGEKITERKPVNFPGQGTQIMRYGPLLYWAWASSENGGLIGEHPHQGFEIISYVLSGTMEHRDSLGTWKSLKAGDLQMMQTNSGVSHSERFADGEKTEMFQIWFEPDLRESLGRKPTYADFPVSAFPWETAHTYKIKHIVGEKSKARLTTDATFSDIQMQPGGEYKLGGNDVFVVLVTIEGKGRLSQNEHVGMLDYGDAAYLHLRDTDMFQIIAEDKGMRFALIVVPAIVGYPLYPNR